MSHLLTMGDARRLPLADGSIHCVVTSPPYFGLRDYGTAAWEGGDPGCDHRVENSVDRKRRDVGRSQTGTFHGSTVETELATPQFRDTCGKCGARRVDRQLGLEQSPEQYLAAMVEVFREVKRVLRPDGTLFLNMGDSFGAGNRNSQCGQSVHDGEQRAKPDATRVHGSSKQLLMMPHRLALALQADGCADPKAVAIIGRLRSSLLDSYDSWEDVPAPVRREIARLDAEYSQAKAGSWYVRMDCVWNKPNPMPESVTDRPTKSHEYVFLLAKRERYYWDADAVREKHEQSTVDRCNYGGKAAGKVGRQDSLGKVASGNFGDWGATRERELNPSGRNLRSVWSIPTHAFKGAHFATMPVRLASTCIKAGTSQAGCCGTCGKPWQRLVERESNGWHECPKDEARRAQGFQSDKSGLHAQYRDTTVRDLGFRPACPCDAGPPKPCTVLDPFSGAASVGVAASALGRRYVGVDLSPKYLKMARRRLERPHARHEPSARVESLPLFPDEA